VPAVARIAHGGSLRPRRPPKCLEAVACWPRARLRPTQKSRPQSLQARRPLGPAGPEPPLIPSSATLKIGPGERGSCSWPARWLPVREPGSRNQPHGCPGFVRRARAAQGCCAAVRGFQRADARPYCVPNRVPLGWDGPGHLLVAAGREGGPLPVGSHREVHMARRPGNRRMAAVCRPNILSVRGAHNAELFRTSPAAMLGRWTPAGPVCTALCLYFFPFRPPSRNGFGPAASYVATPQATSRSSLC